jgi:hypothetical protein
MSNPGDTGDTGDTGAAGAAGAAAVRTEFMAAAERLAAFTEAQQSMRPHTRFMLSYTMALVASDIVSRRPPEDGELETLRHVIAEMGRMEEEARVRLQELRQSHNLLDRQLSQQIIRRGMLDEL